MVRKADNTYKPWCSHRTARNQPKHRAEMSLICTTSLSHVPVNIHHNDGQDKKITSFQPAWLIRCSTPH